MLSRLIYVSECTDVFKAHEVDALLESARRHNTRHDLTGMLAFDSRYFLQVLEGDREALSALYGRLVTDPRHRRVVILGVEPIERRRFADWAMAFAPADTRRKSLYLRHGPSSRFEPYPMQPQAALDLMVELGTAATDILPRTA